MKNLYPNCQNPAPLCPVDKAYYRKRNSISQTMQSFFLIGNKKNISLLLLFVFSFFIQQAKSQCAPNAIQYPAGIIANGNGALVTISTNSQEGQYSVITNIVNAAVYKFTIDQPADIITVRRDSVNGAVVGYGTGSLSVTTTSTADLYVHWNTSGCGTGSTDKITTVQGVAKINSLGSTSTCSGGSITINGRNLLGAVAANVTIGGVAVSAITTNTATRIIATVTTTTSGTVSVTNTAGTGTSAASFTVNANPINIIPTAAAASVCYNSGTDIQISSSENGVDYQLKNNATNANVGTAVSGNGSTINLPTGNLTAATTFYVTATNATTTCNTRLANVTVSMTTPVFTCPGNQTVNLNASCSVTMPDYASSVSASSSCPGAGTITVTQSVAAGTILNGSGMIPITITATDAQGSVSTCSFNLIKKDVTPPVITSCPSNIVVNAPSGACGAMVNYTISANDNCSGSTTCAPTSIAGYTFIATYNSHTYFKSNTNVNWATAKANAIALGAHLVTISSLGENSLFNSLGQCWIGFTDEAVEGTFVWVNGEPVTYTNWNAGEPNNSGGNEDHTVINYVGNAWNDLDGANALSYIIEFDCQNLSVNLKAGLASGSMFPVGTTSVTNNVTDTAGNTSANCTFTVTVNDVTPPTIACPANITITAPSGACDTTVNYTTPIASDNCGTCSVAPAITGFVSLGIYNGNAYYISTGSFGGPAAIAGATAAGGTIVTISSAAENKFIRDSLAAKNYNGSYLIGINDAATEGTFVWASGAPVSYTNWASGEPNDYNGDEDYAQITSAGTWNDVSSTNNNNYIMQVACITPVRTAGPASGSRFPIGTTTITYTATDPSGNVSTCSFTVTVNQNAGSTNKTVTAATATICSGTGTNINVASDNGVSYQLRNNADNSNVGTAVLGTGGTISLPTGNLSATTTFNVYAKGTGSSNCYFQLTNTRTVNVNQAATVTPGATLTGCQSSPGTAITLSGASVGGGSTTGAWSIISGGGTLSSTTQTSTPSSVTYTSASGFSGTVTLRLTTNAPTAPCAAVNATRTITINAANTVTPGTTINTCVSASPSAITLSGASIGGSATTGAWSITSGSGTLSNTSQTSSPASITYTAPANYSGTVTLTLTTDGIVCSTVSATKTIIVNAASTVTPGAALSACQSTPTAITLTGASVGGGATTGAWSITTGGGTLSSTAQTGSPQTVTYTPAANSYGTITLTLTTDGNVCTATSGTRTVTISQAATVSQGGGLNACQGTNAVTLTGASVGGGATTGAWSIVSGSGTLSNTGQTSSPQTVTYTPAASEYGSIILKLTTNTPSSPCGAVNANRTITIYQAATVTPGSTLSSCQSVSPSAITLTGASVGGAATTGAWSIVSGGGTLSSTAQTATPASVTYTPAANYSGTVTLTLTTNAPIAPCTAQSANRTITINPANMSTPGSALAVCQSAYPSAITLSGTSVGGSATTGAWSITSGGGTLSSTAQTSTPSTVTYTPAANYSGTVTLTLTTDATTCSAVSATKTITVNASPSITLSNFTAVCSGTTSQVLTYTNPLNSPNQYYIDWSNAANTAGIADVSWSTLSGGNINVTGITSTPGSYSASILVKNTTTGCQADVSNGAAVMCSTMGEGGTLTLTASAGVFTAINFASYGSPTGTCGNFVTSAICHSTTSLSVIQTAALGRSSFSITANNTNFGDPCSGTAKNLFVEAVASNQILVVNALNTVTPGSALATCQSASPSAITLSGASVGGTATTGAWSITSGGGTLSSTAQTSTPSTVTYTAAANYTGTVTLTLTTDGTTCAAVSATRTITVNPINTVTPGSTLTTCRSASPSAITLSGASIGGSATTGAWSITSGGGSLSSTAQTASPSTVTYTPAANFNGTVTLTLTTNGTTCAAVSATRTITVNALNSVTPGSALATCQAKYPSAITLSGASVGGSATTGAWSITSGGGTLSSTAQTGTPSTVTYTPAANYSGTVTLTLTSDGATCGAASATRTITVNGSPSITLSNFTAVCSGVTSQVLTYTNPLNSPNQYSIDWSNAANTAGIADVSWSTLSGGTINVTGITSTAGSYSAGILVKNTTTGCVTDVSNSKTVVCSTMGEYGTLTMTATSGIFSSINFASYGSPTGSCGGTFGINPACHTAASLSIVQTAALGNSSFSILAGNATFGDPCNGTVKNLFIEAVSSNQTLVVNALPVDKTPSAVVPAICSGSSTNIQIPSSQSGINYQLRNNADNSLVSAAMAGNGGTINLSTGVLTGTTTFNVLATSGTTYCGVQLSTTVTVTINATGQWIGGSSGSWNMSSNWCGGLPTSVTDVNIPAGVTVTIQTSDAMANKVTIASGSSLVMTGSYNLNITAGGTFTNNGTFNATASTGKVSFAGDGTISGTTTFKNIETYGALDFGPASTVGGVFTLQTGGGVKGNSPTYTCPTSTLLYRPGNTFTRGLEWTNSSTGAGYPANVIVQNNTTIDFPASGDGYVCYDLQVDSGSALLQDYSGSSAKLSVGRNVTISGKLELGKTTGGDITLGGNWVRNTGGVFIHNDRIVTFDGTGNFSGNGTAYSTISAPASSAKDNYGGFGGENFAQLRINKTNANDSVVLSSNITIMRELAFVKGTFSLRNNDITLVSNDSRTADIAPIATPANVQVRYAGTGRFAVQRFVQNPTAVRSWRLLSAPLDPTSSPTINTAWQEGVVNADRTHPENSNPWPGYGTQITGPGGAYSAVNGFDQGTSSGSLLYMATDSTWLTPANTTSIKVTDQSAWMLFVRGDRGFKIGNQYVAAQNATLEPKGKIYVGNVARPVTQGIHVQGNPYASAITLKDVDFNGTAGKNSNYYKWDPKMFTSYSQPGKWVAFAGVGNSFVYTSSATNYSSDGIVESGDAILIDAASTGNVTYHETDKLALTSSLAGISNRPASEPTIPIFRSDMFAKSGSSYALTDGVLNIYDESYDNAVDYGDAKKMISFNTKESFSIARDGQKIAIERRHNISVDDTIFFAISRLNPLPYQLRFTATNFDATLTGYLEDKYTNTSTPISMAGTTAIDFVVTSDAMSQMSDRFKVVFKPSNVLPVTFSSIKTWQKNKDIAVEWKVENELNIKQYEVQSSANGVDFQKANITAAKGNYAGSRTYDWLDVNAASGDHYYRIRSIDFDGKSKYSSIVKVTIGGYVKAGISVYPNPVANGEVAVQFNNMAVGDYKLTLMNNLGQVLQVKTLHHIGGNVVEKMNPGYVLPKGVYSLQVAEPNDSKIIISILNK